MSLDAGELPESAPNLSLCVCVSVCVRESLRPSGHRCRSPHRPLGQLLRCMACSSWLPCPGSACRGCLHTARSSWLLPHATACHCSRCSAPTLPLQMYSTTRHGISLQTLYRRAAGERCAPATCLQLPAPCCSTWLPSQTVVRQPGDLLRLVATPNRQQSVMLTRVGGLPVELKVGVSVLCMAAGHSPTILVIRDSSGFVFGAYCSEHWRVAPRYQQLPLAARMLPLLRLDMPDSSTVHAPVKYMPNLCPCHTCHVCRYYGSGETFVFQLEVRGAPRTALRGRHWVQHELPCTRVLPWEPAGLVEDSSSTLAALCRPAHHQPRTTACSRI